MKHKTYRNYVGKNVRRRNSSDKAIGQICSDDCGTPSRIGRDVVIVQGAANRVDGRSHPKDFPPAADRLRRYAP
jgi:hypothetical protein